MAHSANRSAWLHHVLALIGYALLTLVMTHPVSLRISSRLAGSGDDMWLFQWNNWWLRQAIFEGLDPYFTTYLFHPQGASLVYHNFSWLNTLIWLAIEPATGYIAAYNVTFLLTFVLSGYAMYSLVHYLTKSQAAAFVAGLVFAFSPYHLSHYNHLNLISVQWLPLSMLFLIRTVRKGRWRDILLCILFLTLTALSRWQLLVFAGILIALYLAYSLLFERVLWSWRTALALLAIGLGTAALVSPLAHPLIAGLADREVTGAILTEQQEWAQTDLLAYVIPNRYHPVFGQQVRSIYDRFRKNRGNIAFLGYSVLLLGGYGAWRARRAGLYWALAALCFVALALGPILRFNGQLYPGVPMPYRLVGWLPLIKALRNADRFNVVLSLPLAVLVGYGVKYLLERVERHVTPQRRRRAIAASSATLAGLMLFEYLSIPLPTKVPLSSPFYQDLAQEAGDFAILEVPMGRGYSKAYMFGQTLHGKRLVEGHISRTPPEAYDYIRDHPFIAPLSEDGDMDTSRCDLSRQLDSLAADGIRYIAIHRADVSPERLAVWRDYLTISAAYEDDNLLVYRTSPLPDEDLTAEHVLGGNLTLVQAKVTPTQTAQGGVVWVDLRWTATYTPAKDYDARLTLTNPAGEAVQESTGALCRRWTTSNWGPQTLVVDRRQIRVDPYLPPATHQLVLSVVESGTGAVLPPTQPIATVEVSALARTFTTPPMQYRTAATFGGAMALRGYDLHRENNALHLFLHWQALERLDYYKIFVHLYDARTGHLVAQRDTVPRDWTYPTNWWEAGEVVSDEVTLTLEEVADGIYRIGVGVYDPDTLERLPVRAGDGAHLGDLLELKETLHIP